jgi:hypothetical protein
MTYAVKKPTEKHHLTATQKTYVGTVAVGAIIAAVLVSIPPLGQLVSTLMH